MPSKFTAAIIAAAIDGFEAQKARIDVQIAELRAMLPGGSPEPVNAEKAEVEPQRKRKKFSAAARKRMKEAQQRRWAKTRGDSEPLPPAVKQAAPQAKRKLSTGKAAIGAATKKPLATIQKAEKPATKTAPAKKKMSPARKAALLANLAKARSARAAKRANSTKAVVKKAAAKAPSTKAAKRGSSVKKAANVSSTPASAQVAG